MYENDEDNQEKELTQDEMEHVQGGVIFVGNPGNFTGRTIGLPTTRAGPTTSQFESNLDLR